MKTWRPFAVDELAGVIERALAGRGRVPVRVLLAKVRQAAGSGSSAGVTLAGLVRAGRVVVRMRGGWRYVALVPERERRAG